MKTTEEKAKAYDNVVGKLKQFMAQGVDPLITRADVQDFFPELKESEDERVRKELFKHLKEGADGYEPAGNSEDYKRWLGWFEKQGEQKPAKNIVETWKDMRLEVYQQASGNRHEPNYSDDTTKMFSLNDIDEIIEKISEQKTADKVEPKFHEGDIIIHKELGGDYIHNSHKIIQVDILDKKYRLEGGLVAHFSEQDDYELVEQNPAWSEEQMKQLGWIAKQNKDNMIGKGLMSLYQDLKKLKEEGARIR